MPFPTAPRVLYEKNPLDTVVCQLRFPAILKIDAELPAQFQDTIRHEFPNFTERSELRVPMPMEIRDQIPKEVLGAMMGVASSSKNYEFTSIEGEWIVNLTRSHIALANKRKYRKWEEFRAKLEKPLEALIRIYSPSFITRIGLRYVDVVKRSDLGLTNVPWRTLLAPPMAGLLGSSDVGDEVEMVQNMSQITLPDGESKAKIVSRLIQGKNGTEEQSFVIDSDFSLNQKTSNEKIFEKLDFFHIQASRLIQWAFTDRLKVSMKPESI